MEYEHQKEQTFDQRIEELRKKVEETRQSARETKEKRGILIKEIADAVEGNQKLSHMVTTNAEYMRGYKNIEERQEHAIEGLEQGIREAKDESGDNALGEDLSEGVSALKNILGETRNLHKTFIDKQKEASSDVLEFAVDAFMQGGLAPEIDEEAQKALKEGVMGEIKKRQEEQAKERAKENVKETIKQYGASIEAVKKEFEVLRGTVEKGLEEFGGHLKKPELLHSIAKKIQEIEKKGKKINSVFSYSSKRFRLRNEMSLIKGDLHKLYGTLWEKLNTITSQAERFLRQQKGDYDYGRGEKRLGTIGEPYRPSQTRGGVDPELETMSGEKVKEKDKLLQEIEAYIYGITQKKDRYIEEIEKIIPEHFRKR